MDDDEESEDEDFTEQGLADSEEEEGEFEQSEDIGMSEESIDKDELKALAKTE